MAVSREPILKRCRYLGISPMVMGISKESNRNPGANNRKKLSEYGMQLKEKQKLKFIYGVGEKQFYHYFEIATKMEGKAGDNLVTCLESRLDSVVFRMGLALTRREARQLVPLWLDVNKEAFSATVTRMPVPEDLDYEVAAHLIVELYSK